MSIVDNNEDLSNGWESIAEAFIEIQGSNIGASTIEKWAGSFEPGQAVLDVGCGFGGTYTKGLIDLGINLYGIDASKTLIHEHRKRFPSVLLKCESAETSTLFDRTFDGILSVGLIFLLSREAQVSLLQKLSAALNENGRLLFSAPYQICDWKDVLTGRQSLSLGREMYINILKKAGLTLIEEYTDVGENHYFYFRKKSTQGCFTQSALKISVNSA